MSEEYPQREALKKLMGEDDFDVKLLRNSRLLGEAMYTASELGGFFEDMSLTREEAIVIYKIVAGCLKAEREFRAPEVIAKVRM
jgi:hypothetical protein